MTAPAPDPVRVQRGHDDRESEDDGRGDADRQHERAAEPERLRAVAGEKCCAHVEEREQCGERAGGEEDLLGLVAPGVHEREGPRCRVGAVGLLGRTEHRCLLDRQAHVEADADQNGAEQERNTPPVIEEDLVGVAEDGAGDEERGAGEDEGHGGAELREHRVQAAFAGRRVLRGEQGGTGPLAADRESLTETQQHQQDRCRDPDRRRAGQQSDHEGRDAHQDERGDQRLLAADPVTVVPEQHGAHRPGDERHGECREGSDRPGGGAEGGKEHRGKHEGSGGAVDEEVVELDGRADATRDGHLADAGTALAHRCGGVGYAPARRGDCGHSIPPWSVGTPWWAYPG